MGKGRKPDLNKAIRGGAVSAIRQGMEGTASATDEPNSAHIARAEELRPDELTEAECKVWDRLAPQLVMLGRLKPHFIDSIADYCVIYVRVAEAHKYLNENEWSYGSEGRNGSQRKMRPEVAQINEDWRKMRSLRGDFGLSPVSERGVTATNNKPVDDGWGAI